MRRLLPKILLLAVTLLITIPLADLLFRMGERLILRPQGGSIGSRIQLSRLNYNDTTVSKRKGAAEFRVLSFGDSFAYTITKYPFSYHGVAASILNELGLRQQIRIVNLGEPAVTFWQYMKAYEHWGPQLEHDAVVFNVYLGNDFLDVAYEYVTEDVELNRLFAKLDQNLQTSEPLVLKIPHKFPLRSLDYLYAHYKTWTSDIKTASTAATGPYNRAVAELDTDVYLQTAMTQMDNFQVSKLPDIVYGYEVFRQFVRMVSTLRMNGVRTVIMLSPNEVQVTADLREQLADHFQADMSTYDLGLSAFLAYRVVTEIDPEIPLLNLLGAFACASEEGQDLYYGTDTHWSVQGNRLAGETLARFMALRWLELEEAEIVGLQACVREQDFLGPVMEATEARRAAFDTYLRSGLGSKQLVSSVDSETREAAIEDRDERSLHDPSARADRAAEGEEGSSLGSGELFSKVTGVTAPEKLFDGKKRDPDGYSTAPLGSPVVFEFAQPTRVQGLTIQLYDLDGRFYLFTVEVKTAGEWRVIHDRSREGQSGQVIIALDGRAIETFRILGRYNSDQRHNPANRVLHLQEVEVELEQIQSSHNP